MLRARAREDHRRDAIFRRASSTSSTAAAPSAARRSARSPLVDKVAFTGSTEVGRRIQQLAASTIKKVTLELGGKSANIILDDADLEMAVDGSLFGCFFHQGQACESGTRLFVLERLYDDVVGRLVERTKTLTIGDPMEFGTAQGPLISARQRETVLGYIKAGVAEGAKVAVGGKKPEHLKKGYYVEPTILTDVKNDMKVAQEEIFGPVLVVIRYKNIDDAIRMANDSIYGLGGAVWSKDKDKAMVVAKQMRTGHRLDQRLPPAVGRGAVRRLQAERHRPRVRHGRRRSSTPRSSTSTSTRSTTAPAKFWYGALFGA